MELKRGESLPFFGSNEWELEGNGKPGSPKRLGCRFLRWTVAMLCLGHPLCTLPGKPSLPLPPVLALQSPPRCKHLCSVPLLILSSWPNAQGMLEQHRFMVVVFSKFLPGLRPFREKQLSVKDG